MDWMSMGIGFAAALAVIGLLALVMKKPELATFMPYISTAFKFAEAAIPDNTPNASLAKADAFLKKFNELYATEFNKPVPKNVTELAMRGATILAAQAKASDGTQAAFAGAAGAIAAAVEQALAARAAAAAAQPTVVVAPEPVVPAAAPLAGA